MRTVNAVSGASPVTYEPVLKRSRTQNVRFQAAPAALWFQAVAIAQFSRCLQVFSRSHQLSDLPDMSQIVHGPLMQHLLQGDFAGLLVPRAAFTGASRQ